MKYLWYLPDGSPVDGSGPIDIDMMTGVITDPVGYVYRTRVSEFEKEGYKFVPVKDEEVEDDGFITVDNHSVNSDGGPASYYDFPNTWKTWNDLSDYKAKHQWGEYSFHMGNIGKALFRFGEKTGTSKLYDIKKIIYSGLRILMMMEGKQSVRDYLQKLLDDQQFN